VPYVWTLAILLIAGCAWLAARRPSRRRAPRVRGSPRHAARHGLVDVGALSGLEIALFTLLAIVVVDHVRGRGDRTIRLCHLLRARKERARPVARRGGAALTRPEGTLFAMLACRSPCSGPIAVAIPGGGRSGSRRCSRASRSAC
jgi:hypothetical protein